MKQNLIRLRNFGWWALTNLISSAALDAALSSHYFRIPYLLLGIIVWPMYLIPWYTRMKKAKGRGLGEHPLAYYFRVYWHINLSENVA